jgi:hypothetical protein
MPKGGAQNDTKSCITLVQKPIKTQIFTKVSINKGKPKSTKLTK